MPAKPPIPTPKISESRASILTQMAIDRLDVMSKIAELHNRITRLER